MATDVSLSRFGFAPQEIQCDTLGRLTGGRFTFQHVNPWLWTYSYPNCSVPQTIQSQNEIQPKVR